jgi:hypothetical protein
LGGGAGVVGAAAAALGFADPQAAGGGDLAVELEVLRKMVSEWKVGKPSSGSASSESKKKNKKSKKKAKSSSSKKKKKKKGKKHSGESHDDSDSESSSSSSSTGSDSSETDKYMQWDPEKKRKITQEMMSQANLMKFKKRADMLNFHYKHPGALAALFLWQVRQRLGGKAPRNTRDLARVDAAPWAQTHANLKEIRDQREVSYLTKILLELGHNKLAVVADLLVARIREIIAAKRDGGSWEKASVLSLLPGSHGGQALLPEAAFLA